VLTKYNEANRHNGKTFTPELACKIICELGGYNSDLTPAGIVPYSREFDLQIDSGQKITSTNKVYKNHYFTILKKFVVKLNRVVLYKSFLFIIEKDSCS